MNEQQLWVEHVGQIIIARIRGECTEELLKECHARVLCLARETGQVRVLYDALEMEAPRVDLLLLQQQLELETKAALGDMRLRKAILVPDSRLAYRARIAFGEADDGEYRVFYNDLADAIRWLED
jgi:hypothetical protein